MGNDDRLAKRVNGVLVAYSTGVGLGIFVGAVPGFSSTNVLIILLPFTLGMDSGAGMAFASGLYSGSHMGGVYTCSSLQCAGDRFCGTTCFDGYPMTQQGRGQEALAIAFVASTIGGLFWRLSLWAALPYLSRMVYYFGSIENFVIISSELPLSVRLPAVAF